MTPFKDNITEGEDTVTWTLQASKQSDQGYFLSGPPSVTMTLADDVSTVNITLDDGEMDEASLGSGGFTVTRTEDGAFDQLLRVWVKVSGSGTINQDYSQSGLILWGGTDYYIEIPGGQSSASATMTPTFDEINEGEETVIWTLQASKQGDQGYFLGDPLVAAMTIADFVDLMFKDGFEDRAP